MMSLKQLSKISKRNKYSVYGWIREKEQSLNITNVTFKQTFFASFAIEYVGAMQIYLIGHVIYSAKAHLQDDSEKGRT